MARRPRYELPILLSSLGARCRFLTPAGIVELTPEEVWNGVAPERALLCDIQVPLNDGIRVMYDRSLRPVATLALSLWKAGNEWVGRAAIATEHSHPFVMEIPSLGQRLTSGVAKEVSRRALSTLPLSYADVSASQSYLRKVGEVMLRRQLEAAINA
jgi:hypothetical protein